MATANIADYSVYELASRLLGGKTVLGWQVDSNESAHDLVKRGMPALAMLRLIDQVSISTPEILYVLGVSERSYARRKSAAHTAALSMSESGRVWRFAELLAQAIRVFGNQEAAEQWFQSPALALNKQKPIDLMATEPGAKLVSDLLTRLEYGVYT